MCGLGGSVEHEATKGSTLLTTSARMDRQSSGMALEVAWTPAAAAVPAAGAAWSAGEADAAAAAPAVVTEVVETRAGAVVSGAVVVIGGIEQKAHFFALDLPHSDACYVRAYPAATAEAGMDGHVHAFGFFGAVPQSIVYDNDRCLVSRILPDGTRLIDTPGIRSNRGFSLRSIKSKRVVASKLGSVEESPIQAM